MLQRAKLLTEKFQHILGHHPQCAIELHIAVDAFDGTGLRPSPLCGTSAQPAFDEILLNSLINGP
jgi:hypothetical protein